MGVYSAGNPYGIDEDIMYSFPMTTANGEWTIVAGLEVSDFSRTMMGKTEEELVGERQAIADLL
jgi:malate dehydrogenase